MIAYKGNLTLDMLGFYKSNYSEGGQKKPLLATQFEPVYARKALPCFDEPTFKAKYDIAITCPKNYIVLTNTQPVKRAYHTRDNLVTTWFKTTPKMSSYLVAFVISQFERAEKQDEEKNGYIYNVFARPSATKNMGIAKDCGTKLIDTMSAWIKIDYADMGNNQTYQVAIPDFAPGAMENWGLITYRENALLDEGNITTALAKQGIITCMAHEISHQWFGDYVTTYWWSDIWLNEGFATYFESHIPSKVLNYKGEDLELEKQFVLNTLHPAFINDEQPTAAPLSCPDKNVSKPVEDEQAFDGINYGKGGVIVRMMSHILGLEVFQRGLNAYLQDRKYDYTTSEILLEHLEKAPGNKVEKFATKMKNWIHEPGFPLVTAKLNKTNSKIVLTQEPFIKRKVQTQWYVPISYTNSTKRNFTVNDYEWLQPNGTLEIDFKHESWIIFNLQASGYYRVNYDAELWDNIIAALKGKDRGQIDILNRAQLINDIFNIARIGQISYDKVFALADYLQHETDYYPWRAALDAFKYLLGKIDDESEQLLKKRILGYLNTAFGKKSTNSAGNNHLNILKNAMVQLWACEVGQKECIEYAKKTFDNYKKTKSLPDYNGRYTVFCYALKYSNNATRDYNFLFDIFKKSNSSIEQAEILYSLGCITNKDVLLKYLQEAIATNSPIRKQDTATVFASVLANRPIGLNTSLTFFEKNFTAIYKVMQGFGSVRSLLKQFANTVNTDYHIKQVKKIITDNKKYPEIPLIEQQVIDIIEANKNWTLTYGAKIKTILKQAKSDATSVYVSTTAMITLTVVLLTRNLYNSL